MRTHSFLVFMWTALLVAGCAHTSGSSCPAAIAGDTSPVSTATPVPVPSGTAFVKRVNRQINAVRRELSICYTRSLESDENEGMFMADLFIDAAARLSKVQFVQAGANNDMQVLKLTPVMMECIRDVLSKTPYPANPEPAKAARVFFVGHLMSHEPARRNNATAPKTLRGYIMNTWDINRLQSRLIPVTSDTYFSKSGALRGWTVRTYVRKNRSFASWCYVREMRMKRYLKGDVTVALTISPWGDVTDAYIAETEMDSAFVNQCVAREMKNMEFPPNPNGMYTDAHYTFRFRRK